MKGSQFARTNRTVRKVGQSDKTTNPKTEYMKKMLGWLISFALVAVAVAIIFRVGVVKKIVVGA